MRLPTWFWALGLLGAVAGCGDGGPTLYPVEGTVTVDDKPAAGVYIVLYPADEKLTWRPAGVTDQQGAFRLTMVGNKDGAPAGKYQVTANWPGEIKPAPGTPKGAPPPTGDDVRDIPPDQFNYKYADPKKSGLTCEITTGKNQLAPFALKGAKSR